MQIHRPDSCYSASGEIEWAVAYARFEIFDFRIKSSFTRKQNFSKEGRA